MRCVVVESPFAGKTDEERRRNQRYLDACLRDCFVRGESPYASHAIGPRVLDDHHPAERQLGIDAGYEWYRRADAVVFYVDLGWSPGMEKAKTASLLYPVEVRRLGDGWDQ